MHPAASEYVAEVQVETDYIVGELTKLEPCSGVPLAPPPGNVACEYLLHGR